jgi:hypothetical protein
MSVINSRMQEDVRPTRIFVHAVVIVRNIFLYSFRRRDAMRLARRALVSALAMLVLCAAVSAQTLRSENDPRNISPAVGTGGPVGGPTGLFTVYDGQTLRRGEFTFDLSYSNYDRDPGNVDITQIPSSFQVGLSDHLELFFNTDHYKGVKVNNPQNLSSFYLPNSQLRFYAPNSTLFAGTFGNSGPAIVLAPTGTVIGGVAGAGAVFRPAGTQPFIQFPFTGSAGTFGVTPVGTFNATTGPARGGGGRFGAAGQFPGIGSPYGSILPGIVLATGPVAATATTPALTVPTTFTAAPSYLPDAPFINRRYGTSSYSTFVIGGKFRFTGPENRVGLGLIPFYRFYADKANDFTGFNQLQRGSSPGGSLGDFGLVAFADARASKRVNLSFNAGYILNSNPRSSAFGGSNVNLLDRPDELMLAAGVDFPINKHFQPIGEIRYLRYVAGDTPNAFENNPIDALVGVKIYPRRWMGIGLAYRRHMNQQDAGSAFGNKYAGAGTAQVAFRFPATTTGLVGTTGATSSGTTGFINSDDPNGFIVQFFIGHRNARAPEFLPNQPPTVALSASTTSITLPCPTGTMSTTCTPSTSQTVQLSANASDPDGDTLYYSYTVTGGRITGEGPNVTWDLTGAAPGTYAATVAVDDGCGCVTESTVNVTVAECTGCVPPCPTLTVDCPTGPTQAGTPVTFTVNAAGGNPNVTPTFNWSVSAGTITSGQGTNSITVDTAGLAGQSITATVEVSGLAPECARTASCTAQIAAVETPPAASKFDEYGNVNFNDEKARLDNFAIQLQNNPSAQGYIIAYGGRRQRAGEAQARADRAKNYLVNTRGIDAGRIVTVDGGNRENLTVELWVVPTGAQPPAATPDPNVQPQIIRGRAPRRATRRAPRRR